MHFTLATSIVALGVLAAAGPQPAGQRTGIAIPITKRSSWVNADQSVNFDALDSHTAVVNAKIRRGFANYEKNTGRKHPSDMEGVEKRGAGVSLTHHHGTSAGSFWYGSISVGTPAKSFNVEFDTGSSDLFLAGSACDSSCNKHNLWDPSASSTSHDRGQSFNLAFDDGSTVSGDQYADTVSIAGFSATSQTVGAAKRMSGPARYDPTDGLMGMGFESISAHGAIPVFQTLVDQKRLPHPVFSFKLSSSGAELYIGGSNPDLYTGEFTYTPVTHKGFWQVIMDGVEANGATILTDVNAIIDTGATFVYGVSSDVSTLYNALGGKDASDVSQGFYTLPCDSFPTISLTFGGKSFPFAASALNLGPVSAGSSDCLSGIVALEHSSWIIGSVFLQGVYTAFDMDDTVENDDAKVGFADLA